MDVTARQLNRATLARQLLLQRERIGVVAGVHRVVALQAQEPASPYLALWNRLDGFEPAELDAAFAAHRVVKATLMRITLHAVTAEDHPRFHAAMVRNLRASRLNDRRFNATGLTIEQVDDLLPELLAFVRTPRTKAEIEAMLADRLGASHGPGLWWAMRTFAPVVHAPTDAPWTFGTRPAFRAAPTVPAEDAEAALQHLVWRYLEGFGPATAEDVAQFALQQRKVVRAAIESLRHRLVRLEGPDGRVLFDVPEGVVPDADVPAPPRFLPMWDSVLLAYLDRSRLVPPAYRKLVTRRNGDVLPTLLVDGEVCGVWRPVEGGIEARAFHPLRNQDWLGLAAEAQPLSELLAQRDADVYGRYRRWWTDLPAAEVRVLGA
ncbi:winged helix DNA-binding domain-containing protein [Egicoccus sp. AB-alg6-2]|uniref:winged helix DNA-binding domain-containing protein n=1 Tax=Egicoccus sp. AB-alg6-2 TaxID=3242692 RepID=UPI00359E3E6C